MRHRQILLMLMLAIAGCKGTGVGPRVDNPVVGPPPPRRVGASNADFARRPARDNERRSRTSGVELTGLESRDDGTVNDLEGNRVVATVNGAPIFESEILERYASDLNKMRAQTSEEEYRKQADMLIERDLKFYVERKLLSEEMRKSLKKEQKKQLEERLKQAFKGEISEMKEKMNVTSTAELDRELQKQGTSLSMVEHQFRNKVLAQQYVQSKIKPRKTPSRQELFAVYQRNRKDYEIKARVKWQQILISRQSESNAKSKVQTIVQSLREGADFGELAAELSEGPTADEQGLIDWTNQGSLADEAVEKALFALPVGQISEPIKTATSYQFVRVIAREKAGYIPFEKVQDKIRSELVESDHSGEVAALIGELWDTATIDSPYKIEAPRNNERE